MFQSQSSSHFEVHTFALHSFRDKIVSPSPRRQMPGSCTQAGTPDMRNSQETAARFASNWPLSNTHPLPSVSAHAHMYSSQLPDTHMIRNHSPCIAGPTTNCHHLVHRARVLSRQTRCTIPGAAVIISGLISVQVG